MNSSSFLRIGSLNALDTKINLHRKLDKSMKFMVGYRSGVTSRFLILQLAIIYILKIYSYW